MLNRTSIFQDGRINVEKARSLPKSKEYARAKGLCFNCRKPGHISYECPERDRNGKHINDR